MLGTLIPTFIVSTLIIISVPRTYTTDTKVVPEMNNDTKGGGTLGSLASSFGIDLTEIQSKDAISPLLYPELLNDNEFVYELFKIPVKSKDGSISCLYYHYLHDYQKEPWWMIGSSKSHNNPEKLEAIKPYQLSKEQDKVATELRSNISISTDAKKGIITITTTSQDPLVCKTLADSVRSKLQEYITKYRTNKARTDYNYYKKLVNEAKTDYVKARQQYGSFADANTDILLESFKAKQNDLENDMQLKFNNYNTLLTQLQVAKAKIQEQTPAFTIMKGASVPVKPSGPKRMMFVGMVLILTLFIDMIYILRKDFFRIFA